MGYAGVGIANTGNINTTGAGSDGIFAVSTTGSVQIISTGDILATGVDSSAIRVGGYAGNLLINSGTLVGGTSCVCGGAGVFMYSNGDNVLINRGSISALSGLAIYSATLSGSNTVHNFGTITAPGGRGFITQTLLSDQFVQTGTGTFAVDINGQGASDQIAISDTAQLAGKVAVNVLSLPAPGPIRYVILTAPGGVTDNGLGLSTSPALHAALLFPDPNTVELGIAVDFTASGLNRNQMSISNNLNSAFTAGGGGLSPVLLGLLNTDNLQGYKAALDQLLPAIYLDNQIAALQANLAFSNALLSCRVAGADTASIIREGQCLWAGAAARFLDSNTTFQNIGFNENAGMFAAGAQVALDRVWRLGFAVGYQSSTLETSTGAKSDGKQAQAGVALKYNPGPLLLAGALTTGRAWNDTRRPMAFGGFASVATGDQEFDILSSSLRAAYVFGTPSLYFKPVLDASVRASVPAICRNRVVEVQPLSCKAPRRPYLR
jgi:hypothetical protein